MQRVFIRFRSLCLVSLVCLAVAGCGNPYPHYENVGSSEGRSVVVYLNKKGDKIKVPAGTALGGMPEEVKEELSVKGEATWEHEGVTVTMVQKGVAYGVKEVQYKGKKVPLKGPL